MYSSYDEQHLTADRKALFDKYDVNGPRYTSYPTALQFTPFDEQQYRQAASELKNSIAPLSLYLHIPFCENICYYCACNKVVTRDKSQSGKYIDYLNREMQFHSELTGKHRPVTQLHFGGGTPTFLSGAELTELMHHLASCFNLTDAPTREYSIEIDPRTVTHQQLALLKGLGFNRLSLGVQDFNPEVQQAINRIQSVSMVRDLTMAARRYTFKSVSFDLIYGLPHQTPETLAKTIETVVDIGPDRIAFYNYAHLPERFKTQRSIDRLTLPDAEQKLEMLALITDELQEAGYLHIGMDHFVKADDDLAALQKSGRLQRNFQGYSACLAPDLIGMGVSAITSLSHAYAQNEKTLDAYYDALDRDQLPVSRGLLLTDEDEIRRQVIMSLACNLAVDMHNVASMHQIDFKAFFSEALMQLAPLVKDGLVVMTDSHIRITEEGRAFLRNICMCFDAYLKQAPAGQFSKTL